MKKRILSFLLALIFTTSLMSLKLMAGEVETVKTNFIEITDVLLHISWNETSEIGTRQENYVFVSGNSSITIFEEGSYSVGTYQNLQIKENFQNSDLGKDSISFTYELDGAGICFPEETFVLEKPEGVPDDFNGGEYTLGGTIGYFMNYRSYCTDTEAWEIFVVNRALEDKIRSSVTATNSWNTASIWAQEGIKSAINKGFVPTDLQDSYTNVITRAEFCRMAVKFVEYKTGKNIETILKEKDVSRDNNAFSDTNDQDILAAFALGITSGTGDNKFTPNGQFSREQAATMILNTCKVIGIDTNNTKSANFADIATASNWAVEGINFCGVNGIMNGTGNNNFSPKSTYTREQSIVTFSNIK